MFYGNFTGERSAQFREAIVLVRAIFGGVYAADNLITFSRSAGFLEDTDFRAATVEHALTDREKSRCCRVHNLLWAAQQVHHVRFIHRLLVGRSEVARVGAVATIPRRKKSDLCTFAMKRAASEEDLRKAAQRFGGQPVL